MARWQYTLYNRQQSVVSSRPRVKLDHLRRVSVCAYIFILQTSINPCWSIDIIWLWLDWLIVCRILWIQSHCNYYFPDSSMDNAGLLTSSNQLDQVLSLLSMAHLWISADKMKYLCLPYIEAVTWSIWGHARPGLQSSDPIFPTVFVSLYSLRSPLARPSSRPISSSRWRVRWCVLLQHSAIFPTVPGEGVKLRPRSRHYVYCSYCQSLIIQSEVCQMINVQLACQPARPLY